MTIFQDTFILAILFKILYRIFLLYRYLSQYKTQNQRGLRELEVQMECSTVKEREENGEENHSQQTSTKFTTDTYDLIDFFRILSIASLNFRNWRN